ncbi:MAG TPA: SDR family oxidoreductase [Thermoplasmata archaeon]|nr:SDR family oxidoreductase [Thermoplasmata archaeon]
MAGSLDGKVVLVAGVGKGLGTATVALLASEGARVIAVARHGTALSPLEAHARHRNWNVEIRTANLFDATEVDRLVHDAVEEFGGLDAASVNVGHWVPGETALHRMSADEWSSGLRDNLDAIYLVGRAAIPHFLQRGRGSLVVVSAALAVRWAGSAAYCAAKGGIVDLVPKLARDYRATGIRVNAVLPGSMSGSLEQLDPPPRDPSVVLTDQTRTSPWEVARAIRYFVSDESRWVTGAVLTVDGGASTFGSEPGASP